MADLARHPTVRPDLAARNLVGLAQHRLLKWRDAAQVESKPPPALELIVDLGCQVVRRVNPYQGTADILAKHLLKLGAGFRARGARHALGIPRHVYGAQHRFKSRV